MPTVFRGKGTVLVASAVADTTEVTITQVVSISPPSITMGTVETTDLSMTARDYESTILGGNTFSATLNWDPDAASHDTTIWTVFQAGTKYAFEIMLPNNTAGAGTKKAISFTGVITDFDPSAAVTVDGIYTLTITVQVCGLPTIAST
jgi:hypothetical protein